LSDSVLYFTLSAPSPQPAMLNKKDLVFGKAFFI
jgi:hypothetical protein